jgi:hypothetical protein
MMKKVMGFVLMGALAMGLAGCYTVLRHPSVMEEERALAARDSTFAGSREATCTDCHNNEYDHQGNSPWGWHGWGGSYYGGYYPFGNYNYNYNYNPWQRYYYDPWWYNSGWGWGGWGGYYNPWPYYPGTPGDPGTPSDPRPVSRRGMSEPPPPSYNPPPAPQNQEPQQNPPEENNSNDNQRKGRRGSGK